MTDPRRYFGLTGPSKMLDRRVNAMRGDLADVALSGKSFSPHYAVPIERTCVAAHALMHQKPDGEACSELLEHERFWLLDRSGGWAWGYSAHDHYVGYVREDVLGNVTAPLPQPQAGDPVEFGEYFIGMPYVWGGRGGTGIDCSGLVQRSLRACMISAPRDSDMQMVVLGTPLGNDTPLARGDLMFFPGHVGMMADDRHLLHATVHHGRTLIEPLADVIDRIALKHAIPVLARKRVAP